MKIEPKVVFNIKYIEPDHYGHEENIKTIQDLKNFIYCQRLGDVVSYALNVSREVYFYAQTDEKQQHHVLTSYHGGKNIITDNFKFIVADKLTYFGDLQKYLLKNSSSNNCQNVELKNFVWFDAKKPIFFTGAHEYNCNLVYGSPSVENRPLVCRPLTEKDIVLDKKLQQIFPKKTGKIPEQLVQLLSKTTEKIY